MTQDELIALMKASFEAHHDWDRVVDVVLGNLNDRVLRAVGAGELGVEGRQGVIVWCPWLPRASPPGH